MAPPDPRRLAAIRAEMDRAGLDALFCRLGENLLPLTGYWPGLWLSAALIWADGEAVIICPESEADQAAQSWAREIRMFRCWRPGDPDPETSLTCLLRDLARQRRRAGARIGYEGGFDLVGPAHVALEQPAAAYAAIERVVQASFEGAQLIDATAALYRIRAVKTPAEVAGLRIAAEIAAFGLEAFRHNVAPGRSEVEVAAAVEHAVQVRGTGYKGVRLARACAQVTAGPATSDFWGYPISRPRPIQSGELAVIEMGVVADGLWADVARGRVAGPPDETVLAMAEAVRAAQDAAAAVTRPGARAARVNAEADQALRAHGYDQEIFHSLGHGLGFRYHEPEPWLDPASDHILEPGMLLAMEPGLYRPGQVGLRLENNVLVTPEGAEVLTTFARDLVD